MPKHKSNYDTAVVEVIALSGFDKALAYAVPATCQLDLKIGSLVRIPLRRRSELGVVARLGTDQVVPPGKLKMLFEVVQPYPVLPPDLMDLFYSVYCIGFWNLNFLLKLFFCSNSSNLDC